ATASATASAWLCSPNSARTWSSASTTFGRKSSRVDAASKFTASSRCTTTPPSTPPSTAVSDPPSHANRQTLTAPYTLSPNPYTLLLCPSSSTPTTSASLPASTAPSPSFTRGTRSPPRP